MPGAMILAAGRGERMRPLSDACPKPLLEAGGKPLIVWQIEALARAGFRDIVINAAHLAGDLVARLGDGSALGVSIAWSVEPEALRSRPGQDHRGGSGWLEWLLWWQTKHFYRATRRLGQQVFQSREKRGGVWRFFPRFLAMP